MPGFTSSSSPPPRISGNSFLTFLVFHSNFELLQKILYFASLSNILHGGFPGYYTTTLHSLSRAAKFSEVCRSHNSRFTKQFAIRQPAFSDEAYYKFNWQFFLSVLFCFTIFPFLRCCCCLSSRKKTATVFRVFLYKINIDKSDTTNSNRAIEELSKDARDSMLIIFSRDEPR